MAGIPYIEDRDDSFIVPLKFYAFEFVGDAHEARRGFPYVTGPGAYPFEHGSGGLANRDANAAPVSPFIHGSVI